MSECQHVWSNDDCGQHCVKCGIGRDVADLTAERDALRDELRKLRAAFALQVKQNRLEREKAIENGTDMVMEFLAERDAALARIEELKAALKPLAALWRDGMERDPDSKTLWDHPDITVGDIRRARHELGEE